MGLDMYLHRRTYISQSEHTPEEHRYDITVSKGGVACAIQPKRICYITEEIAYWRKANAIHKWFVDNCQDGVDDCRETLVLREQLEELVTLCKQVLSTLELVDDEVVVAKQLSAEGWKDITEPGQVVAQQKLAESMLPTKAGFFFGSTNYDQYYIEDLKYTAATLEAALAEDPDSCESSFYYHSSW